MNKTFIIAEAGVNHNGDVNLAKQLIDAACKAGCDAIKFQTINAEQMVIKTACKAQYQIDNTGNSETQYEMLKKLELYDKDYKELFIYARDKKIQFLSTAFDEQSADLLEEIGVEIFKIPSGEITNKPYLKYIAIKHKPILLSTGMSTLGEVEEALGWIYEEGNTDVTLLHCTSDYPVRFTDVNLKAMITLAQAFKTKVGYSDHTLGIEVPIAAAALGASVIEKHFTLCRDLEGPDHKASLEPDELYCMVEAIRNINMALGNGIKKTTCAEIVTRDIVRKSIVAKKEIQTGEVIDYEMLCTKRPGTGIYPKYASKIVGKIATRDIQKDELICWSDLQL